MRGREFEVPSLTLPRKRGRENGVNQVSRRVRRSVEGVAKTSDKGWTGFDRQDGNVSDRFRRPGSSAVVSAAPWSTRPPE